MWMGSNESWKVEDVEESNLKDTGKAQLELDDTKIQNLKKTSETEVLVPTATSTSICRIYLVYECNNCLSYGQRFVQ